MEEIWKDITGFNGLYKVSNLGRVKNAMTGRLFKCTSDKGYIGITLCSKYGYKRTRVHRLVAQGFIPNPENKPTVNHKNGIKSDNRVDNLEWATYYEQTHHASINGLMNIINLSGEKARKYRLKDKEINEIRVKYNSGLFSYNDLAIQYRSCKSHIGRIIKLEARK